MSDSQVPVPVELILPPLPLRVETEAHDQSTNPVADQNSKPLLEQPPKSPIVKPTLIQKTPQSILSLKQDSVEQQEQSSPKRLKSDTDDATKMVNTPIKLGINNPVITTVGFKENKAEEPMETIVQTVANNNDCSTSNNSDVNTNSVPVLNKQFPVFEAILPKGDPIVTYKTSNTESKPCQSSPLLSDKSIADVSNTVKISSPIQDKLTNNEANEKTKLSPIQPIIESIISVKESAKESVKELIQELVRESIKESVQEPVKEPVQEPVKPLVEDSIEEDSIHIDKESTVPVINESFQLKDSEPVKELIRGPKARKTTFRTLDPLNTTAKTQASILNVLRKSKTDCVRPETFVWESVPMPSKEKVTVVDKITSSKTMMQNIFKTGNISSITITPMQQTETTQGVNLKSFGTFPVATSDKPQSSSSSEPVTIINLDEVNLSKLTATLKGGVKEPSIASTSQLTPSRQIDRNVTLKSTSGSISITVKKVDPEKSTDDSDINILNLPKVRRHIDSYWKSKLPNAYRFKKKEMAAKVVNLPYHLREHLFHGLRYNGNIDLKSLAASQILMDEALLNDLENADGNERKAKKLLFGVKILKMRQNLGGNVGGEVVYAIVRSGISKISPILQSIYSKTNINPP